MAAPRIAENTEPLSTRIIPSNGPVRAVLEVMGGLPANSASHRATGWPSTVFNTPEASLPPREASVYDAPSLGPSGRSAARYASALGAEGRGFRSCRPDESSICISLVLSFRSDSVLTGRSYDVHPFLGIVPAPAHDCHGVRPEPDIPAGGAAV